MDHRKKLSFVLPVYNEEKNIVQVYSTLIKTIQPFLEKYSYEILFVDDGSTDSSWQIVGTLVQKDAQVR